MANTNPSAGIGHTLAGGVQDVAAILPLIGTEQCEKHVGSALTGGYLYAAAAPLSIFGSLGIVRAGIAILVSSISVTIPDLSILDSKSSLKGSNQQKWLGGKLLRNAGFELTGVVAPLIGMDGHRFRAETRLMEMLEEKHIDDPEKITLDWKSLQWNTMLVICTVLGAVLSLTPYIALLLGPTSWRPASIHLPWLFPVLRIVGSCTATVACQFILQSRVISLMKNRVLFMIIHRRLNAIHKEGISTSLKDASFQWDKNLPAEQCIWSLEKYISATGPLTQLVEDPQKPPDAVSPPKGDPAHVSIPMDSHPSFNIHDLHQLQREHFRTPTRDLLFLSLSWIFLALSLPASVAGYVGCFTLVGATPTNGNGPLVWAGLEAALSLFRIAIWASNPAFDEGTEVTLGLKLLEHQPLVNTDDYNPNLANLDVEERKPFTLIPEREFLERLTSFTGPLDRFQRANNITLYFTLISNHGTSQADNDVSTPRNDGLLMTVFDLNMQLGVTFGSSRETFGYFDAIVKYDTVVRKFQAHIQSEKRDTHPWRIEDDNLFNSLTAYYRYIVDAFEQRKIEVYNSAHMGQRNRLGHDAYKSTQIGHTSRLGNSDATLRWKWDITHRSGPANLRAQNDDGFQDEKHSLFMAKYYQLYFDQCIYEHRRKTTLVLNWSAWIVKSMETIRSYTLIDCHEALKNTKSGNAQRELTERDAQLAWEWAHRELVLLTLSLELEDSLRSKMETCAYQISRVRQEEQVISWMRSEFESGQQKRMQQEREASKRRMEGAMMDASKEADEEGRPWQDDGFAPEWTQAIDFIDKKWSAGINNQRKELAEAENELRNLIQNTGEQQRRLDDERCTYVEQLKKRVLHEHWRHRHKAEEDMMKDTVKHIRTLPAESTRADLDLAYIYPEPDQYASAKFARLEYSSSKGKACSATVYDAEDSDKEAVCDVIAKSTTRSVVRVAPKIVSSIPPNDHLLFLQSDGAKEPAFVKRNRDRWWDEQTGNASMFYFSPWAVDDGDSCWVREGAIVHVLVFLTAPSTVQIGVLHRKYRDINLSIQENRQELGRISNVPSRSFRLDNCQSIVLPQGRHELELVPDGGRYYLRDVFVTISDIPYPSSSESNQGAFAIQDA